MRGGDSSCGLLGDLEGEAYCQQKERGAFMETTALSEGFAGRSWVWEGRV